MTGSSDALRRRKLNRRLSLGSFRPQHYRLLSRRSVRRTAIEFMRVTGVDASQVCLLPQFSFDADDLSLDRLDMLTSPIILQTEKQRSALDAFMGYHSEILHYSSQLMWPIQSEATAAIERRPKSNR